jgi:hypothetical protein
MGWDGGWGSSTYRLVALDPLKLCPLPMLDVGPREQVMRVLILLLDGRGRDPMDGRGELGQELRLLHRLPYEARAEW